MQEHGATTEKMLGKWEQMRGKIKETWAKMTDDDIALYESQRDQFYGKLRELYGLSKEEAEIRMKQIEKSSEL